MFQKVKIRFKTRIKHRVLFNKTEKTKLTRWLTVILSFLALIAFAISAYFNYQLNSGSFKWMKVSRENEIRPHIILTPKDSPDLKNNIFRINIKNIGRGPAKYILLCVSANDKFLKFVINSFKLDSDSAVIRDYIQPGEELTSTFYLESIFGIEFESMPDNKKLDLIMTASWYFYFSYFDMDGNEYLSIERLPAYNGEYPLMFGDEKLNKFLWEYAKTVPLYSQKTFLEPRIRDKTPLIINRDSLKTGYLR